MSEIEDQSGTIEEKKTENKEETPPTGSVTKIHSDVPPFNNSHCNLNHHNHQPQFSRVSFIPSLLLFFNY